MKAHIWTMGDSSVGIDSEEITIEFHCRKGFESKEDREAMRKDLKEFFVELCDDKYTHVMFDDECADCGCIGEGNHYNGCPSLE